MQGMTRVVLVTLTCRHHGQIRCSLCMAAGSDAHIFNRQSKAVVDSPLMYTRNRDLYALGIVLLKMLLGSDITERFADGHEALQYGTRPTNPHPSRTCAHTAVNQLTFLLCSTARSC